MIRVLHSVSNMDRAGIETMLMNYYRHIDREKVQFDFLCNKRKAGAYDDEIKKMGGRIYHTPGLNPARYPRYLKYMEELFKKNHYHIIEAHNDAMGVYALYAAKINHIPVRIFHAHSTSIPKDWKLPIKFVCKVLLPANTNQHFSCSVAAGRYYFGSKAINNYELIPNAIEVGRFVFNKKSRDFIRKQYGLVGRHIVGHVGRFMAEKNHTFLIDIFAEIEKRDPLAILVLLGDGELLEKIKKKVKRKGLQDKVFFIGNVGNANEWYNVFDVFVLPSLWEGLPVVGVEAQANDLPCIFSDSVTKEIAIAQRVEFIPLKSSTFQWAEAIMSSFCITTRNNNTELITDHNYNIVFEAKKLQNRYMKLYGQC